MMNVVKGGRVIENAQTKAFRGLEDPVKLATSVARKLQEKLPLMTTMSDVPDVAR